MHGATNVSNLSVTQIFLVDNKDFESRKSDLIDLGNSHGLYAQCLEYHRAVEQKSALSLAGLSLQ